MVVLLALAACLAVRAIRQRRRYRTATQMAIARGGQLPDDPNDYWGLSGLSGWTPEGLDRFGLPLPSGDRNGGRGRWQQIPVIWDGIADEKLKGEEETDGWGFAQVSQLHSAMLTPARDASFFTTIRPANTQCRILFTRHHFPLATDSSTGSFRSSFGTSQARP